MKKTIVVIVAVLTLSAVASNGFTQDYGAEIRSLKAQIQAIRQGSIQSNSGAAEAIAGMQGMQSQLDSLRASIEANGHMIRSQIDGMNAKLSDMESRIGALEDRLSIQSRQVSAAVSSVAPEAAEEARMYQKALRQINDSEYLTAVATLKTFKRKFPKSAYAADAGYWLSECYFAMRDYEQAIKGFQAMLDKYPRSKKAPSALLKQGYAFAELGMDTDAKVFFNNVIRKYPKSREAAEAKSWIKSGSKPKTSRPTSTSPGDVPLAPGVKVDNSKASKNSREKYK